ncbi:hypothetical protein IW262DRAFT_1560109 [Armillaria fumosa]|nr:hypothetical protein IW262DRAFT_1560109 [Armillaria fumosa]
MELLDAEPQTECEKALQKALQASQETINNQKTQLRGMQATAVIQNSYVHQAHACLQEQEERKKRPKKRGRLNGDGMPKLFTSDAFTERARAHAKETNDEEEAKAVRENAAKKYKVAMEEWKKGEEDRMAINERKKEKYQHCVAAWEAERSQAKTEGRKMEWKKPKLADFELEKQRTKPTLKSFVDAAILQQGSDAMKGNIDDGGSPECSENESGGCRSDYDVADVGSDGDD